MTQVNLFFCFKNSYWKQKTSYRFFIFESDRFRPQGVYLNVNFVRAYEISLVDFTENKILNLFIDVSLYNYEYAVKYSNYLFLFGITFERFSTKKYPLELVINKLLDKVIINKLVQEFYKNFERIRIGVYDKKD